jgi:hypothetical protein
MGRLGAADHVTSGTAKPCAGGVENNRPAAGGDAEGAGAAQDLVGFTGSAAT